MREGFTPDFQNRPQFQQLLDLLESSANMTSWMNDLVGQGGSIGFGNDLGGQGGKTTSGTGTTTKITLDPGWLPAGADAQQIGDLASVLAHELGHALHDPFHPNGAANEGIAEQQGLQGEGYALRDEYRAAKQMGVPMHSQDNNQGQNIEQILDGIAAEHGGYDSDAFSFDAIQAGMDWAQHASPSTVPGNNIEYPQYYRDQMDGSVRFAVSAFRSCAPAHRGSGHSGPG